MIRSLQTGCNERRPGTPAASIAPLTTIQIAAFVSMLQCFNVSLQYILESIAATLEWSLMLYRSFAIQLLKP